MHQPFDVSPRAAPHQERRRNRRAQRRGARIPALRPSGSSFPCTGIDSCGEMPRQQGPYNATRHLFLKSDPICAVSAVPGRNCRLWEYGPMLQGLGRNTRPVTLWWSLPAWQANGLDRSFGLVGGLPRVGNAFLGEQRERKRAGYCTGLTHFVFAFATGMPAWHETSCLRWCLYRQSRGSTL